MGNLRISLRVDYMNADRRGLTRDELMTELYAFAKHVNAPVSTPWHRGLLTVNPWLDNAYISYPDELEDRVYLPRGNGVWSRVGDEPGDGERK